MFYNIKMKLLIAGKNRNIYMRKDGSAYYKSGGENVDVTYMFKKNGGGLKKQYIGGVQNNLGKVEKHKKRSNKGVKQILGGAGDGISFDPIKVESEKLVDGVGAIDDDLARKELEKLCYIALNGLSIKSNELKKDDSKDKIKISIGNTPDKFKEYVDNNIDDATKNSIYGTANTDSEKLAKITEDFGKDANDSELKKLGFTEIEGGVTVTRAYILNKILQCFKGDLATKDLTPHGATKKSEHPVGVLKNETHIINPKIGEFNTDVNTEKILDNIVEVLKLSMEKSVDELKLHTRVRNLHTILFKHEKIGAPAPPAAAAVV